MIRSASAPKRAERLATLGPASSDAKIMTALLRAGVDAFRLNGSHACRPCAMLSVLGGIW